MIIIKLDNEILTICKSFGIKDISKLTRKQIVDKNGHTRIVYVNNEKKYSEDKSFYYKEDIINYSKLKLDKKTDIAKDVLKAFKYVKKCKKNDKNTVKLILSFGKFVDKSFIGYSKIESNKTCRFRYKSYINNSKLQHCEICLHSISDKRDYNSFIHETLHAIDMLATGDTKESFSDKYNDELLELFALQDLPEEIRNFNKDYLSKVKPIEERLKEIKNNSFEYFIQHKNEYDSLIESYDSFNEKYDKQCLSNGYHLINDIFNALSKNKLQNQGIVPKIRKIGYYNNNKPINEILAQYCVITLSYPELKKVINNSLPNFTQFMDNIILELLKARR